MAFARHTPELLSSQEANSCVPSSMAASKLAMALADNAPMASKMREAELPNVRPRTLMRGGRVT